MPATIAIVGPTAGGKSALALAAARRWPAGIVAMDSAQVYRGLDVGTAKPTAAERAAAPHHLIDVAEPAETYSAARFAADARAAIAALHAEGRAALIVGGTLLYLRALVDGLDAIPQADAALREALGARGRERGWPALHAELAAVDPATAARLAPNDAQRIQRALEVWHASGRPISAFRRGSPVGGIGPVPTLSVEPADRGWLRERIARRFDAMLGAGLVDEVRGLRARGDLHAGLPSMRAVGYRQTWQALDDIDAGVATEAQALARLRERGVAATCQLAKRQTTWLRSMPQRRVVAADAPGALPAGLDVLAGWIEAAPSALSTSGRTAVDALASPSPCRPR